MTVLRWHSNADPRLRLSGDTIDLHQRRVCDMCHSAAAWLRLSLIGSDLLRAAMHHDEAERVLGDMPGPAKEAFPALAAAYAKAELSVLTEMGKTWNLTRTEHDILTLCDKLDAYEWAVRCDAADTDEWRDALAKRRKEANALGLGEWLEMRLTRPL
jgi:5'-deoxynucleotidase YfbR-like HD superfamily hydrolase